MKNVPVYKGRWPPSCIGVWGQTLICDNCSLKAFKINNQGLIPFSQFPPGFPLAAKSLPLPCKVSTQHATRSPINETIQEILGKYGDYPFGQFPHIEWLKERLLEFDSEIEEICQDRDRLLSELCKARDTINIFLFPNGHSLIKLDMNGRKTRMI